MKAWPLHVVFATLLVGSLAANRRIPDMVDVGNPDLEPAVTRVASSNGLTFEGPATLPGTSFRALQFAAPGCARPVLVASNMSFDEEPVVRADRDPDDTSRFVYIGRSWEKPDRLAFFVERMKYAALATFGLTRYMPAAHLIVVEAPTGCAFVNTIDWRNVWNRDYFAAVQPDPEPAVR
jgi:hypothetical protein